MGNVEQLVVRYHEQLPLLYSRLRDLMLAILVAAVSLCALSLALRVRNDDCSHPPMQEVVPEKAHGYIRSVTVPSMYDCAAECKLSPLCLSFVFHPEKQTCQRLAEKRAKSSSSFTAGSGVFFSNIHDWEMVPVGTLTVALMRDAPWEGMISRCDDEIGMNCTRDDDCLIMMTSCYRGRCLCHPGYSHSITRNSCDRDCKRYANNMTLYKGLAISHHNRKKVPVNGELKDVVKMCTTACVEETSFLCKTADITHPGKCHLSSEGYLDVSATEREQHMPKWWLAVRGCL